MAFADLLQHTVTVYTLTTTKDSSGGTINAYTAGTSFSCLIRGASSSEVVAFAAKDIQVSHIIVATYGSVGVGSILQDSDGLRYDVRGIKLQRGVGNIDAFTEYTCWQLL